MASNWGGGGGGEGGGGGYAHIPGSIMTYDALGAGLNSVGVDVERRIVCHGPLGKGVAMQGVQPAASSQHGSKRTWQNGRSYIVVGGHVCVLIGGKGGEGGEGEVGR